MYMTVHTYCRCTQQQYLCHLLQRSLVSATVLSKAEGFPCLDKTISLWKEMNPAVLSVSLSGQRTASGMCTETWYHLNPPEMWENHILFCRVKYVLRHRRSLVCYTEAQSKRKELASTYSVDMLNLYSCNAEFWATASSPPSHNPAAVQEYTLNCTSREETHF